MAKMVLIDAFHVSVLVPADLATRSARSLTRTLKTKTFQARLRQTIARLFRGHESLQAARIKLSR
jgi:hypothetical protein